MEVSTDPGGRAVGFTGVEMPELALVMVAEPVIPDVAEEDEPGGAVVDPSVAEVVVLVLDGVADSEFVNRL